MNILEKIKLTAELDSIANDIQSGSLGMMARIEKVRRIDQIIALLTEKVAEKADLNSLVQKHGSMAIRLRPQHDFEKSLSDYAVRINDIDEFRALQAELRSTKLKGSNASFLRDQLGIDLNNGVILNKFKGGMKIAEYITPANFPHSWNFINWLFENKRLVIGPNALDAPQQSDMYPAQDEPLKDPETLANEANADFEQEAQEEAAEPLADEAGAFYQSVIDGADVDANLIEKALEYAEKDETHYLLPEAAEVIKQKIIASIQ
jgi:hypothetical protein